MSESADNPKSEYAKRVKAYREAAHLSQEDFAEALGVGQPYIARLENGKTNITLLKQHAIASLFGVKQYRLLDPDAAIPSANELQESILAYVQSNNIDSSYLNEEKPNYSKTIDALLKTDFLSEFKTSKEISIEIKVRYDLQIEPRRISDILAHDPRKNLVEIEKGPGKINKYKLTARI